MLHSVGQLTVYFVGENDNVLLHADFGYLLKVRLSHDGSGRIVRERKHQKLGLVRNRGTKVLSCQTEFVLFLQADGNRNALRQNDTRLIGNVAGLRNDDLVARADHGTDGQVDCLAAADRYDGFLHRVIRKAVTAVQEVRNLLAKLRQTGVSGIVRPCFLERINALLADMVRRSEIGLADTEGDSILHVMNNVEKFTNAGRLNADNGRI